MIFTQQLLNSKSRLAQKETTRYAPGICWSKMVYIFVIGSFLGWLWETALMYVKTGDYISRTGLVIGPFNPVYGFGLVVIILALYRFKKWWTLLLFGMIVGGGFEYLLWFLSSKILGLVSWNYSSPFFITINGEPYQLFRWAYWGGTSIFHSFFWGLCGVASIKLIYPINSYFIEKIPPRIGTAITIFLVAFFAFDLLLTMSALLRQMIRHLCMDEGMLCFKPNAISDWLDRHYSDEVLGKIFANLDKID